MSAPVRTRPGLSLGRRAVPYGLQIHNVFDLSKPTEVPPWMGRKLPEVVLRRVVNATPFALETFQKMGPGRTFCDAVVLKARFVLRAGVLPFAEDPPAIELADSYHPGRPAARSSLARLGDLHLPKPGADLLVTGDARPPQGRPMTTWLCRVAVSDRSSTTRSLVLRATGPRRLLHRFVGGWKVSDPEACTSAPVRYELAWGGAHASPDRAEREVVCPQNPSGTGFFCERTLDRSESYEAPRWELPGSPITGLHSDQPLTGFGPVARAWQSRLRFAGTYDAEWRRAFEHDAARGLLPDYPRDFDHRFFHSAHPDLQWPKAFRGDETFQLDGLDADRPELSFRLPAFRVRTQIIGREVGLSEVELPLDTVAIDLDARRVDAVFRLAFARSLGVEAVIFKFEGEGPDGKTYR